MNHKFVSQIGRPNRRYIENISKHGKTPTIRTRASALLLSDKKYTINSICDILNVERHAVSRWINDWESKGRCSLCDKPRPGRKRKLTPNEELFAVQLIEKNPRCLTQVLNEVKEATGKDISRSTLKRVAKRWGKCWKRMRRSLKSKRNEPAFRKAQRDIKEFEDADIDVVYFDGSNFSLVSNVPYAWQDIGSEGTLPLPSEHSESIKVLGFLNIKNNELTPFIIDGNLNSETLVAVVNAFIGKEKMTVPTILIWDNAPAHTSQEVARHIEGWADQNLFIYSLPPYSPELNKIEILWREMKYSWLPQFVYNSIESLKEAVEEILSSYNKEGGYAVNYS